jgi:four helix bundle protein
MKKYDSVRVGEFHGGRRGYGAAKTFEDLYVFQDARCMATDIWKITRNRPFSTDRVLTAQIRRVALSVVSNIAEGFEQGSRDEFGGFLKIAKGSCGELRAQMRFGLTLTTFPSDSVKSYASRSAISVQGFRNLPDTSAPAM